jgi:cytidylate kinase
MSEKSRSLSDVRVAIDGPAGVGKTTTARALADQLGLLYVDTGAMYRALAVRAERAGVSPDDAGASAELARRSKLGMGRAPDGSLHVEIDGEDVTEAIRTDRASDGASRISVHPGVRRELVRWQRELAAAGGVVMEGRDIGTVVLPDAEAKVFLTASPEERARRRHRELLTKGRNPTFESVLRDLRERDARDQGRETSPLRPATDAVVVDCTALGAPDQVAAVRRVVEALVAMRKGAFDKR